MYIEYYNALDCILRRFSEILRIGLDWGIQIAPALSTTLKVEAGTSAEHLQIEGLPLD